MADDKGKTSRTNGQRAVAPEQKPATYHEVSKHIRTAVEGSPKKAKQRRFERARRDWEPEENVAETKLAYDLGKLALADKITLTKVTRNDPPKDSTPRQIERPQENTATKDLETHAHECIQHARWLTMLTTDESKSDAFEVIQLAVRAMRGERKGLPVDRLTRLREIVLQGAPQQNQERDLRTLVQIVGRYTPKALGRDRYGLTAVQKLPKSMHAAIHGALGRTAKRVTVEHCGNAVQALASPRKTINGVVVDLVIDAGLWGYVADQRSTLRIAVSRAARRATP